MSGQEYYGGSYNQPPPQQGYGGYGAPPAQPPYGGHEQYGGSPYPPQQVRAFTYISRFACSRKALTAL